MASPGYSQGLGRRAFLSGGSRGEVIRLLPQVVRIQLLAAVGLRPHFLAGYLGMLSSLEAALIPWLMAPSSVFKAEVSALLKL